ncbi:MAG: multicopper oxidase domain-containing protein [Alphaproteobacteria bacterium]|nr:multicopper oxidase domain-containing protein [Alphaproteobacteria bacterium]
MKRREFLIGTAAAGALPTLPVFAQAPRRLIAAKRQIDVRGRAASVYGLTDANGKPGIFANEGERFTVAVENRIDDGLILHWHGQTKADATQDRARPDGGALQPGGIDRHDFELTPGSHWMHAHTLHEQLLLAAPMIAREKDAGDVQDVVVMLHDFSFKSPDEILMGLTGGTGGAHGGHGVHGAHGAAGGNAPGMMARLRGMMGGMMGGGHAGHGSGSMSMAPHANDVAYDAFLANDRTLDDPEIVRVERNGRVRLRIVNGGTATAFFIDTGALTASCIAIDGTPCLPHSGTRFPIAQGQRLDLLVEIPAGGGAFPIFAQVEAATTRTGIVLATSGASIAKLANDGADTMPHTDLSLDAALRARDPLFDRKADRVLPMVLGEGANYRWTINDRIHGEAAPIPVKRGERIEFRFMNPTTMMHPMHLHGHHFQIVEIAGKRLAGPMRDTVIVPPHVSVTVAVEFDKQGDWYMHCHHLYHMATGMMTAVAVS